MCWVSIMEKKELAKILADMYTNAPKGDATTMIRLFGIQYADELKNCDCTISDIAELSKIGVSYHAEISKGIRLAKYVTVK